jgi:hypothetical protein
VTGAVRLRLPADRLLLVLRFAILAAAVCALAQPVLVTPGRMRAWNAKIARAVVVDVSESMVPAAGTAAAAVDDETRSATTAVRIESHDLPDAVRRAAAHLVRAAPARREIVVISDFQSGALSTSAIAAVPPSIGVRFVRLGQALDRRQVSGAPLLGVAERVYRPEITVDADRTRWCCEAAGGSEGLQIVTADDADRAGLVKAVAASGALALARTTDRRDVRRRASAATTTLGSRWMLETALRLRNDVELSRLSDDGPLARTGASGDALVVDIGASPESYAAAVAVRGVLTARHGDIARMFSEDEVRVIADSDLTAWSRQAPPVDSAAWRYAEQNDARWFWSLVLAFLALEMRVRARLKT